jgi:hypothetical protein
VSRRAFAIVISLRLQQTYGHLGAGDVLPSVAGALSDRSAPAFHAVLFLMRVGCSNDLVEKAIPRPGKSRSAAPIQTLRLKHRKRRRSDEGCAGFSPGSASRCDQFTRHPGRTSSPLRPCLSFRYTHRRRAGHDRPSAQDYPWGQKKSICLAVPFHNNGIKGTASLTSLLVQASIVLLLNPHSP